MLEQQQQARPGASEVGPITYVQGKDTSGVVNQLAAIWNKDPKNAKEKVTVKQQSDQADQQHDDLAQHFQQKLSDYDVVSTDVVWTDEFAAKGYLQPLTGAYKLDTSPFLPSVVKTGQYNGIQYAAPSTTDSQILYYRKDLLGSKPAPTTWDEMMADCSIAKKANIPCYTGQFAKYEGLTVNFNEAITSAGGTVVDAKGDPTLDTPEATAGLTRLTTAFANGNIPKAALDLPGGPGPRGVRDRQDAVPDELAVRGQRDPERRHLGGQDQVRHRRLPRARARSVVTTWRSACSRSTRRRPWPSSSSSSPRRRRS